MRRLTAWVNWFFDVSFGAAMLVCVLLMGCGAYVALCRLWHWWWQ